MWKTATLRKLLIKTETVNPTKDADKSFKYIDVSSVDRDTLSIREVQQLLGKEAPSRARRLVRQGDVIFATVRPTLKRIAIVPNEYDEQVCSTGYIVLRPDSQALHFKYLFYSMQSDKVMREIEAMQTGASYPAVTDTQVRGLDISYPPLPVQKQIVKKLDAAFADIDKAIAATERKKDGVKNLNETALASIMQLDSSADSIWKTEKLGDLAYAAGRIGWKGLTKKEYVDEGILFLSVHGLNYGKFVDYRDANRITQERYDESPEIMLQKNDILLCKDGAGIGKVGVIGELSESATINSSLLLIRAGDTISPVYLYYFLLNPLFQGIIQEKIDGATTPHLYQRDIKNLPINLPPPAEQERIVARLDEVISKTELVKELITQKLLNLKALKSSLLTQAFSGELIKDAA